MAEESKRRPRKPPPIDKGGSEEASGKLRRTIFKKLNKVQIVQIVLVAIILVGIPVIISISNDSSSGSSSESYKTSRNATEEVQVDAIDNKGIEGRYDYEGCYIDIFEDHTFYGYFDEEAVRELLKDAYNVEPGTYDPFAESMIEDAEPMRISGTWRVDGNTLTLLYEQQGAQTGTQMQIAGDTLVDEDDWVWEKTR